MSLPEEKAPRFMGKITAASTHEIVNVLAAIGENSALMQEILEMAGECSGALGERISRSLGIIQKQVGRGVDLTSRLNKFAHTTDEDRTEADLNEMVTQIGHLTQRMARLKQIEIKTEVDESPFALRSNPLSVLMALFNCIAMILGNLQGPGVMVIRTARSDKEFTVSFLPEDPSHLGLLDLDALMGSSEWNEARESVELIHGGIRRAEGQSWFELFFHLK